MCKQLHCFMLDKKYNGTLQLVHIAPLDLTQGFVYVCSCIPVDVWPYYSYCSARQGKEENAFGISKKKQTEPQL